MKEIRMGIVTDDVGRCIQRRKMGNSRKIGNLGYPISLIPRIPLGF
jgi:hypothetical protein